MITVKQRKAKNTKQERKSWNFRKLKGIEFWVADVVASIYGVSKVETFDSVSQ